MVKQNMKRMALILGFMALVSTVNGETINQKELDSYGQMLFSLIQKRSSVSERQIRETLEGILPMEKGEQGGIRLSDKLALFVKRYRSHGMDLEQAELYVSNRDRILILTLSKKDEKSYQLYLRYHYDPETSLLDLQDVHFSRLYRRGSDELKRFFQYR